MKREIKDLFNVVKYKRKFNTYKVKYESTLEDKLKDKETIENLQRDLLAAKDKIIILQEKKLNSFKKKKVKLK